jgi:hypothetical protein
MCHNQMARRRYNAAQAAARAADGSAAMEIEQTLVFERCGRLFWYTILAPLPIPIRS